MLRSSYQPPQWAAVLWMPSWVWSSLATDLSMKKWACDTSALDSLLTWTGRVPHCPSEFKEEPYKLVTFNWFHLWISENSFSVNNIIHLSPDSVLLFFKIYDFILNCVYMRICVWIRACENRCPRWPETLDLLKQVSQAIRSHLKWVVGPKLWFPESITHSQPLSHLSSPWWVQMRPFLET